MDIKELTKMCVIIDSVAETKSIEELLSTNNITPDKYHEQKYLHIAKVALKIIEKDEKYNKILESYRFTEEDVMCEGPKYWINYIDALYFSTLSKIMEKLKTYILCGKVDPEDIIKHIR